MGFATVIDFENALAMQASSRYEQRLKSRLIAEGISILRFARDEPQEATVDDGPVDINNPDGEHYTHTIPVENPFWKRLGFESRDSVGTMLARFEAEALK